MARLPDGSVWSPRQTFTEQPAPSRPATTEAVGIDMGELDRITTTRQILMEILVQQDWRNGLATDRKEFP